MAGPARYPAAGSATDAPHNPRDAPFEVFDQFMALVVEVALTTAGYK